MDLVLSWQLILGLDGPLYFSQPCFNDEAACALFVLFFLLRSFQTFSLLVDKATWIADPEVKGPRETLCSFYL